MSIEGTLAWARDPANRNEAKFLVSLVVPVFNEQENIAPFISEVDECLETLERGPEHLVFEYVFVNDGSHDHTETVIREISKRDVRVRLVNLSRNFGKEAALSAGLKYASGHAVIPMDVDLQDPPALIAEMVDQWRTGAKVVNARRVDRDTDTPFKRWSSAIFYRLINKVADYDIPSNVGDFRLLDRDAVDVLNDLNEHSRFNKGLFSWIGFNVVTVEYSRPVRASGLSKWSARKLLSLAIDAITSSTTLPLRVWTIAGVAIAALSFTYAAYLAIHTVIYGVETPGYASMMVTILFLGGLNLISLGVMGEYLGRVAIQVRGRPLYIVSSVAGFPLGE